ncbi:MAG: DNA alkylation repair protein [Candidatus Bathyarchaeota archaeon]|nr:DNA alkylation repair protein [Candidatus Bathyarchaeota archaeon]
MTSLADRIMAEIEKQGDPERRADLLRYFKEPIETYGLSQKQNKTIADQFYPEVKGDLPAALAVTEELLKTGVLDAASVGLKMLDRFRLKITAEHFPLFDKLVDYLGNWAITDHLTTHMISECVKDDPKLTEELIKWTSSENRWRRRASAVTMVPIARKGLMLDDVYRIAEPLMTDMDDMVQKGVGWMLKEASREYPGEIHDYLVKWKPDTAALVLRYASEKLPQELKVYKTK